MPLLGHVHPRVRVQLEVVSTVAVGVPASIPVGLPITAVRLRVSSVRVSVPVVVIVPVVTVAVGFGRGLCGRPARQQRDESDQGDATQDHERPERKAPAQGPTDRCAQGRAKHSSRRQPREDEGDRPPLPRRVYQVPSIEGGYP